MEETEKTIYNNVYIQTHAYSMIISAFLLNCLRWRWIYTIYIIYIGIYHHISFLLLHCANTILHAHTHIYIYAYAHAYRCCCFLIGVPIYGTVLSFFASHWGVWGAPFRPKTLPTSKQNARSWGCARPFFGAVMWHCWLVLSNHHHQLSLLLGDYPMG